MKSVRYGVIAGTVAALLGCSAAYAEMSSAEEAEFSRLMMDGIKQFKAGQTDPSQFDLAIETFRKAYKINPIPDVLYNIARSYHMMNNCEEALKAYREYALTSAENANIVKDYISELTPKCGTPKGTIVLTCVPESAVLMIDGVAAPMCTGEHKVDKRPHKLSFLADGYVATTREVSFDNSSTQVMRVVMTDANVAAQTKPARAGSVTPGVVPSNTGAEEPKKQQSDLPADSAAADAASPAVPVRVIENPSGFSNQSPLFWSGVGTTAGGVVLSIIGGALIGTAYRDIPFNGKNNSGYYQRSTGRLAGGGVLLGLGSAAVIAGIGLFIADVALRDGDDSQAVRVVPSIGIGPDGSSAMLTMQF